MSLKEVINQGWANHHKDPEGIANNLKEAIDSINSVEDVPGFVGLLTHVYGGHLGWWKEGRDLLEKILLNPAAKEHDSVFRSLAILSYCQNDQDSYQKYLEKAETVSPSKVRVLAQASSELLGQKQVEKATEAFEAAMELAGDNLEKGSPIARSLAISGNNLACDLEEKSNRTDDEEALMEIAANGGRKYWEITGGWLEIERAEYRLAMTYIQSGKVDRALTHAKECHRICIDNKADQFEMFFAHEVLAKAFKACEDEIGFNENREKCIQLKDQVKDDWKQYCVIPE